MGTFDKNLEVLHKKKFISDEWQIKLDQMWATRHSFHHLRPSVECDQQKLEEMARALLRLRNDLEREFFGFTVRDGLPRPRVRSLIHFAQSSRADVRVDLGRDQALVAE